MVAAPAWLTLDHAFTAGGLCLSASAVIIAARAHKLAVRAAGPKLPTLVLWAWSAPDENGWREVYLARRRGTPSDYRMMSIMGVSPRRLEFNYAIKNPADPTLRVPAGKDGRETLVLGGAWDQLYTDPNYSEQLKFFCRVKPYRRAISGSTVSASQHVRKLSIRAALEEMSPTRRAKKITIHSNKIVSKATKPSSA